MKELIYLEDARRAVLHANPSVAFCLDRLPTVDAVEVVHAKWLPPNSYPGFIFHCSNCRHGGLPTDNYCPNCGAKMDVDV